MTAYNDLVRSDFHDTSLAGISGHGSTFILNIEYYDEDDNEKSADLSIAGVVTILRDDVPIQSLTMETTHGSIIALKQENQDVALLLTWVDFSSHRNTTCSYKMPGAKIQLLPEPS